ncbi:MAG TPA: PQQ-binding-like beta-propeller repeat protein, partial [Planctomycetota bacterium]|nr:PQQ-binding-like beta-propeller repeat protein [Planctomycetota bacterium]
MHRIIAFAIATTACLLPFPAIGDDAWPRFRGPNGDAVVREGDLPIAWERNSKRILWSVRIPGEGASSPIVAHGRIFVTSAEEDGLRRLVHAIDAATGHIVFTRTIDDPAPELTSAVTGHAASTPATDGDRVVAFFGNAGLVALDRDGEILWRHRFGAFETELGLASSPIIDKGRVLVLCDHDGDRFSSFDSFLASFDLRTGDLLWRTERPRVFRSFSTPILVASQGRDELITCA